MDLLQTIAEAIDRPGLLLTIVYNAVAGLPMTLLHELGHAVAAVRLLGDEVKVEVGNGPRRRSWVCC